MIRRVAAIALLAWFAFAPRAGAVEGAQPRLQDFAWTAPIAVEGRDALYVVDLPHSVYAGSARPDLADLRVYNGAGEQLPYALRSVAAPAAERPASVALPIFPVWGEPGAEIGGVSVRVKQDRGGAIIDVTSPGKGGATRHLTGYLVDASAVEGRLQALEFEWPDSAEDFVGRVRVESSSDLARWTNVAGGPLVALRHAGHALSQNRIDLKRVSAKYLRVSWPASQALPRFTAIRAEPVAASVETPRTWRAVAPAPGASAGEFRFDLGAAAPYDRLRLELPNPNTVAPVQIFSRARDADPWRLATSATVYGLAQAGEAIASPDIAIPVRRERYWMVRVDARSGGLGAGAPRLAAGFVPQQVLFVARGDGPFVLAYGARKVASGALPVATLLAGRRADGPLEAAPATLGEARAQPRAPAPWPEWLDLEPGDWKKLALWAVLFAGVAALGWMAWRLSAQLGKPAGDGAPRAGDERD